MPDPRSLLRLLLALSLSPAALAPLGCETKADPDLIPWGDPDLDGDGFTQLDGDCDDFDEAVHPEAEEICDGVDNNCDGAIDEGAIDAGTWYIDYDGDGYGGPSDYDEVSCTQPEGYIADGSDCDDGDPTINPGADEVCDGVDNNCDEIVDEDAVGGDVTWYADSDGDGYGTADYTLEQCTQPEGYVLEAGDCDDQEAAINPGAVEVCNELDDNCNDAIDEDVVGSFYLDADGDGYGIEGTEEVLSGCEPPEGYAPDAGAFDCDDGDASVFPGNIGLCDGLDNDCDAATPDEGIATWFDAEGGADWTEELAGGSPELPVALRLEDGGELRFCDGTWYVNIAIDGADVTLSGLNGPERTELSGAGYGGVIEVQGGGYLDLSGLRLSGGSTAQGGALYLSYASAVVANAVLSDNAATDDGGAVYVSSSSLVLTDVEISGNQAVNNGGGLYIYGDSAVDMQGVALRGNSAGGDGGGFYAYAFSTIGALDTDISGNIAAEDGAGFVLGYSSTLSLDGATVAENDAGDDGGAAYLFGYSSLEASASDLYGNGAAARGGGLYISDSSASLSASSLSINDGDRGGGGYVDERGLLEVEGCFVGENSPEDVQTVDGGGYTWGGTASFTCDDAGCETEQAGIPRAAAG